MRQVQPCHATGSLSRLWFLEPAVDVIGNSATNIILLGKALTSILCRDCRKKTTVSRDMMLSWGMSGSLCSFAFVCPMQGPDGSGGLNYLHVADPTSLRVLVLFIKMSLELPSACSQPQTSLLDVKQTLRDCAHHSLQIHRPSVNSR